MKWQELLHKVLFEQVVGEKPEQDIVSVAFDSRKVEANSLFVAQKGVAVNGHLFIEKAIEQGAVVVVCEDLPEELHEKVCYVQVASSDKALAQIASNFYGNPSSKLKLVGVTGTNGKTTIASLLYQLFSLLEYNAGLLSTVKVMVGNQRFDATHTTPDSLSINRYLKMMVDEGVSYCFMEVSSHGIHQSRVHALEFDGGVFTNLSHDHLDYHRTFAEYRDVKKRFFDGLSRTAFALSNADDKNGKIMLQNTKAVKKMYSQKTVADVKVKILEKSFSGMLLSIDHQELWVQLVGGFNASNLAAIYGVAKELGVDTMELLTALSQLRSVDGRFQYQVSEKGVVSIVDYAHTPDALKNILQTINDIAPLDVEVITVVGCGGNRDKEKRPKMAQLATMLSSQVILTSDNPRNEEPDVIIEEMEEGVQEVDIEKVLRITDRKQAIKTACKLAKKGDVILVAGKGHETYQEINGERIYFNDREVLNQILGS